MIFHVFLLLRWDAFGLRSVEKKITPKVKKVSIRIVPNPLFSLCGPDGTQATSGQGNQAVNIRSPPTGSECAGVLPAICVTNLNHGHPSAVVITL